MEGESSEHAVERDLLCPCCVVVASSIVKKKRKKSRATRQRAKKNPWQHNLYINGVCTSFMYEYTPTMYRHGMGFQV
jgi:hypothetical protein